MDDPVIYRGLRTAVAPVNEQIRGLQLEADGSVLRQVTGSHQRRGAISSCIFCGP